jgi:GxxExxY protein
MENINRELLINEITEKIIGCAFTVSNTLGCGFLEKVYENALLLELKSVELKAVQQKPIDVYYRGNLIGEYVADLLVEDKVLVELKTVQGFDDTHFAQCLNYLKATGFEICLLFNFGKPELQIKRLVARKEWLKNEV